MIEWIKDLKWILEWFRQDKDKDKLKQQVKFFERHQEFISYLITSMYYSWHYNMMLLERIDTPGENTNRSKKTWLIDMNNLNVSSDDFNTCKIIMSKIDPKSYEFNICKHYYDSVKNCKATSINDLANVFGDLDAKEDKDSQS